jgi:hypothetical protein
MQSIDKDKDSDFLDLHEKTNHSSNFQHRQYLHLLSLNSTSILGIATLVE